MRRPPFRWLLPLALSISAGCATTGHRPALPENPPSPPPVPLPPPRVSTASPDATEVGVASYYAHRFHGRTTASGTVYDENDLTAAHPTLPFGTHVRVTNLRNDRSVVVTINDRGPFHGHRVIDLSWRAARSLGFVRAGTARVLLEVLID